MLAVTMLLTAFMPCHVDAHAAYPYRYSSVPHWAHYQPARHRHVNGFARQIAHAPVRSAPIRAAGYFVRVFVTGYDDTGFTASGLLAGYGRVAVDPSVFPLGTHFSIPGYSTNAVAADTGGAVRGLRIDEWWPTAAQCYAATGYRSIYVYQ